VGGGGISKLHNNRKNTQDEIGIGSVEVNEIELQDKIEL
jgi:hypothetical protein